MGLIRGHFTGAFLVRMVRWHLRYYLFGKGTPLNSGALITEACNSRCAMCNTWRLKNPRTCPWEAQRQAIDVLAEAGCYYYSVSGGEPTLVEDLPERLAYAAQRIPYVHLVTNGLTMDAALARALGSSGLREISVSLDGDAETHNRLRGRQDGFGRAWEAIEVLSTYAPGLRISVNSLLTPWTLPGLRRLGDRLNALPGLVQKFLPLSRHALFHHAGDDGPVLPGLRAEAKEIEAFIAEALRSPRVINSAVFLRKAKHFLLGEEDVIPEQKTCLYPFHGMEFDASGLAYPCLTGMERKGGVPPGDLGDYLTGDAYREAQDQLRGCTGCRGTMPLCYYEPRLNFPLHRFLAGLLGLRSR